MRAPDLLVRATRAANLRARGILPLVEEALALERRPRAEIDVVVAARLGIRNASGGPTGAPVVFHQDAAYHRRMLADQARHVTWMGLPWWTPRAFVWGADRDSRVHVGWKGLLRDTATGTRFLNTFQASDGRALERPVHHAGRAAACTPK